MMRGGTFSNGQNRCASVCDPSIKCLESGSCGQVLPPAIKSDCAEADTFVSYQMVVCRSASNCSGENAAAVYTVASNMVNPSSPAAPRHVAPSFIIVGTTVLPPSCRAVSLRRFVVAVLSRASGAGRNCMYRYLSY
eukprot:6190644-Pleurochrysis_carterae.AAC.4